MTAPATFPADNTLIPQIEGYTKHITRTEVTVFLAIALFVALVSLATATWGLVALAISALALVPVVLGLILMITFG